MNSSILPRDQVAQRLAVSSRLLVSFERRGLLRVVREGEVEGYPASEIRRLWTVVSLHRDAGINAAGIEAILQLQSQLDTLCRRLRGLADQLGREFEEPHADDEAR